MALQYPMVPTQPDGANAPLPAPETGLTGADLGARGVKPQSTERGRVRGLLKG